MNKNKGFTLIELLVVIAIIGILASVVLASLTTARTKAQSAAVQSTLSSMRAQAELYYSTTGANSSYGAAKAIVTTANVQCVTTAADLFGTDTNSLKNLVTSLGTIPEACVVTTGPSAWAFAATDPSLNTSAYCVDSTGTSKLKTGLTANTPSGAITSGACN